MTLTRGDGELPLVQPNMESPLPSTALPPSLWLFTAAPTCVPFTLRGVGARLQDTHNCHMKGDGMEDDGMLGSSAGARTRYSLSLFGFVQSLEIVSIWPNCY